MIRSILATLVLVTGCFASATTISAFTYDLVEGVLSSQVHSMAGLNFKQGDTAAYKMSIASFINGTMTTTVKSVAVDAVVITQDVSIMGQAQSCDSTINPQTGQIKSIVCNGKPQDANQQGDIEVVDSKEDSVTVPAGTFDCLYVKAHNKKDNTDIEQWINPKLVPVMGLVKMNAPTQLGTMVAELTSFKRN
jgi:hypothetical protein